MANSTASLPDLTSGWKKEEGNPRIMGLACAKAAEQRNMTPRVAKNAVVRHFKYILFFILAPPIKIFWIKKDRSELLSLTSSQQKMTGFFYQFKKSLSI
jgi:hypothetical protein